MKRTAAILLACALAACSDQPATIPVTPAATPEVAEYAQEFEQGVTEVTDGVHVAIGYGLANSVMIEGDNGVIIVDTMESRPRAEQVLAAFREITDKPVKAVILTHNHTDHVFGGLVFTGGDPDIPVYAHDTLGAHVDKIVSLLRDTIYVRSMRMFGQLLPKDIETTAGIGLDLEFNVQDIALARPTHTFSDRLEIEIEGVRLELIHAPGETPDQIVVWMPEQKILLPADNFYRAFPNLYTIRGTAYRDVLAWAESLDLMRDLQPDFLIPAHSRPVVGADTIQSALTNYRDAIQFVHDQTIRGLNDGKTPDELAASIHLPPHLATDPFLQPTYGNVPFSVRSIATGYLGWYGGDAVELEPLAPSEESHRMLEAFSAGLPLQQQAQDALEAGDYRWAAQLARHWVREMPEDDDARATLAGALQGLGEQTMNFPARNYYFTQAMEWAGGIEITPNDPADSPDSLIESLPIEKFMQAMTVRLKAEEVLDVDTTALFRFTDIDEDWTLHLRRGVAEIRQRTIPNPDLTLTTTALTWKNIASRKRSPALALATGEIEIEGGITNLIALMSHFDQGE